MCECVYVCVYMCVCVRSHYNVHVEVRYNLQVGLTSHLGFRQGLHSLCYCTVYSRLDGLQTYRDFPPWAVHHAIGVWGLSEHGFTWLCVGSWDLDWESGPHT